MEHSPSVLTLLGTALSTWCTLFNSNLHNYPMKNTLSPPGNLKRNTKSERPINLPAATLQTSD